MCLRRYIVVINPAVLHMVALESDIIIIGSSMDVLRYFLIGYCEMDAIVNYMLYSSK